MNQPCGKTRGFTLVELMITLTVLTLVVGVLMAVLWGVQRSNVSTSNRIESSQAARTAVDMMARDLRNAGYGADLDDAVLPQPPIAYVDSMQVLISANLVGDIGVKDTLVGTTWEPPNKYRTGAELIRWTIDANNDGQVDQDDQNDADGVDAQHTRNPNDFALLREVYGDSVSQVAGNNGGMTERIALVRKPGSGVPPMFTVYMKGSATAWDWSSGPVPASQLANIERVGVTVVSPSSKPDSKGNYAQTTFATEVKATRNQPNFGAPEYSVDGYVYHDANKNHVRDTGDVGLSGATVRLGPVLNSVTDMAGYFLFRAPAGTYTLKHTAPTGFGSYNSPDSFIVTIGPAITRSFSDTVKAGGWVTATVYNDLNGNAVQNFGEPVRSEVAVTLNPGNQMLYTDSLGQVRLFASTGGYSVAVTPPDSFIVTTPNPVSGTMVNNGTGSMVFGIQQSGTGTVSGTVFRDNNRNGVVDAGETGIQNAYVVITPDGGITSLGYAYTDASGNYTINPPVNDPPHTTAMYATVTVPTGFYPTTTTSVGPIWLVAGQTLTAQNFGMGSFQTITLNASRVLSLSSGDLIEKDWAGTATQNAVKDPDLVLGADAGGTDNVSIWFNKYNVSPIFDPAPTYTRSAPQSVLSMALDTLDSNAPKLRLDLVTGTKLTAGGNLFVWFNQNSSGNEGYFPATYSTSQNYKTLDNGDVQSVLTLDCAGGVGVDQVDLIAGTKSATAGQGTIEIWQSNNAATPAFTRAETYPTAGAIPGNSLGEVTCMALADLDGDGRKDLIVGTRTSDYSGQLMFLRNISKVNGARFIWSNTYTLSNEAVTSLACGDINADGRVDVIVGTQHSSTQGKLQYWQNQYNSGSVELQMVRQIDAPGIVLSVICADYGGTNRSDVAIGFRNDASSYAGGVRIYFTDSGTLPPNGTDPSGGAVTNMVPALNANNFNYGVYPSAPAAPYLLDLAAGVKTSASTGALIVIIR
jgi:prepilin-type N-terminal cleavage/methylation domain-containing protein